MKTKALRHCHHCTLVGLSRPNQGSNTWSGARNASVVPHSQRRQQTASPWVSLPEMPPGEPSSFWQWQLAANDEQDSRICFATQGAASGHMQDVAALEPGSLGMGFLRQDPSWDGLPGENPKWGKMSPSKQIFGSWSCFPCFSIPSFPDTRQFASLCLSCLTCLEAWLGVFTAKLSNCRKTFLLWYN